MECPSSLLHTLVVLPKAEVRANMLSRGRQMDQTLDLLWKLAGHLASQGDICFVQGSKCFADFSDAELAYLPNGCHDGDTMAARETESRRTVASPRA